MLWQSSIIYSKRLLNISFKAERAFKNHLGDHDGVFPTYDELIEIRDANIALAIVWFCQILIDGNEKTGAVAKNTKKFRETHLPIIIERAFPSNSDKEKFSQLRTELIKARHNMLGHASGLAYNVIHHDGFSEFYSNNEAWKNINIDFWFHSLAPLQIEIQNYYLELSNP